MKEDRDGRPRVAEINAGRFFTTSNFFAHAGLNMPDTYVRLGVGERLERPSARHDPRPEDLYWVRMIDMAPAWFAAARSPAVRRERPRRHLRLRRHAVPPRHRLAGAALDARRALRVAGHDRCAHSACTGDRRQRSTAIIEAAERAGIADGVWLPGAATALEALPRSGVAVAIFTRNSRRAVRDALAGLALAEEPLVCEREDVARQKPDPEGLIRLLARLAVAPGDALIGRRLARRRRAATAAGVAAAVVTEPGEHRERPAGAAHYPADLESLPALPGFARNPG
jgi:phosphoglycolate phosphatase-like HAD superfamily hydrolase